MMKCVLAVFMMLTMTVSSAHGQKVIVEQGGMFPMRMGYCPYEKLPKDDQGKAIAFNPFKVMDFIEDGEGKAISGDLVVWTTASSTGGYDVQARYSTDDGRSWTEPTTKPQRVLVWRENTLRVRQVKIVPPDNASLTPYRGKEILVTLIYPRADDNPLDFTGKEKYRSTALFVARWGEEKIAAALAKHAVQSMKQLTKGNARGRQQLSVTFQVDQKYRVIPEQAAGSAEELAKAITEGIRKCEKQKLRFGTTFGEEVEQAKSILAERMRRGLDKPDDKYE